MSSLPMVALGKHEVSRLIVGSNPFIGHSHQSDEVNLDMARYYRADADGRYPQVVETLFECERAGINTVLGRGDDRVIGFLREYWGTGGTMQWIGQTAPERPLLENIKAIGDAGAIACYHHGGETDRLAYDGELEKAKPLLDAIHDAGMVAGLGGHDTKTHRQAEEMGLDVDFYMVCFYNIFIRGEVYLPEDRETACAFIQEIEKPCLAYKILAAGRNNAGEAFGYAFKNIKPTDAVVVGMFTKHHPNQVLENSDLARRFGHGEDQFRDRRRGRRSGSWHDGERGRRR